MNFIYKNLFALPNLRPYTKHKKRIIPAIIIGRMSSFFLLYYTPNSPCWLDGGPPYENVVSKVGGSSRKLGGPDPRPPSGCAFASVCLSTVTAELQCYVVQHRHRHDVHVGLAYYCRSTLESDMLSWRPDQCRSKMAVLSQFTHYWTESHIIRWKAVMEIHFHSHSSSSIHSRSHDTVIVSHIPVGIPWDPVPMHIPPSHLHIETSRWTPVLCSNDD